MHLKRQYNLKIDIYMLYRSCMYEKQNCHSKKIHFLWRHSWVSQEYLFSLSLKCATLTSPWFFLLKQPIFIKFRHDGQNYSMKNYFLTSDHYDSDEFIGIKTIRNIISLNTRGLKSTPFGTLLLLQKRSYKNDHLYTSRT